MVTELNKTQINKVVKFCKLANNLTNSIPSEKIRNKWPDPTWKKLDPWNVAYGLDKDVVSGFTITRSFSCPDIFPPVSMENMVAFYNKFAQYL